MKSAKTVARALSPRRRGSKDGEEGPERTLSGTRRRRTRTPRTAAAAPDLPDPELSEEAFVKEWGITKDAEEQLLIKFREGIEAAVGPLKPIFDKYYLRRFLRARQHDLRRATDMFLAHLKWRAEMGVDDIQETLHFHERDAFLSLYPQGYHKTDRLGRPVYIQHLGQINVKALAKVTTEERMLLFHIQEYERALRYIFPACSLVAGRHVSQTLAVMDLKGVGLRHLSSDVKRILGTITRTDQDNYPETLGKTLIINAPAVFRAIWAVVKPMLDVRTQAKIQVCSGDFLPELERWVHPDNIPTYLGGRSTGSLLDDVGPWHDPALVAEIDAQRERAEGREAGGAAGGESPAGSPHAPSAPGLPLPPRLNLDQLGGVSPTSTATATGTDADDFFDAMARRLSSVSTVSSYASADEGGYYSLSEAHSGGAGSVARRTGSPRAAPGGAPGATASSDGESWGGESSPTAARKHSAAAAQISILARVRALEERLPAAERPVRRFLPPAEATPSRSVGQGTLVGRVAALERAMDTLLKAQELAMEAERGPSSGGAGDAARARSCCACCSIM